MLKFLAKYIIPISILASIIVIVIGIRFAIVKVGVDQIGVRTVIWGIKRGVVKKDYGPGWHRYIRRAESWDLYDGTVQTFNMTRDARSADGKRIESQELPIRTADDYDVTVDIVVKYQIKKGRAYKIRQEIGPGDQYKSFLESDVREVARNVLGKMTEKNLYDPDEKRRRAEEAKLLLQSRADERHVDIIDWLILDMRFDPQLERKIKNVKLAGLDELLNIAKEKAVRQRGITQTIDATTEALSEKIQADKNGKIVALNAKMTTKVTTILAGANKFMIEKKAEGDLYKEERRAAGELLVARARAEGERLRRKAMTGPGGDLIVALEAARNINLADIVVSTQVVDFLNIDEMINKLGGNLNWGTSLGEGEHARVELRKKSERENFFKIPRRMPDGLRVPDELETEFKTARPKVTSEELQKEIEEEWNAFIDEGPEKEQSSEEIKKNTDAHSTELPEEMRKKMEEEWEGSVKEFPVSQ